MITRRRFATMAAASLGSGLVLGQAQAMDPIRFDRPVRLALTQHFDGVARGNADALSAIWARDAQVQHVEKDDKGQEMVTSEPAAEAIQRWTKDADLFAKGKILSVELLAEKIAYATVEFTWRNIRHIELFTLLFAGATWRITNKVYHAMPTRGVGSGY
jgi:hypothetical protein